MRQCCLPAAHGRARRSVERCMSLHDVLYIVAHHALLLSPAARNCRRKPNGLITEPCFYVPPTASLGCLRFGRLRFGRLRFGHSHLARGTPRWVETVGRPTSHTQVLSQICSTHQTTAHMYKRATCAASHTRRSLEHTTRDAHLLADRDNRKELRRLTACGRNSACAWQRRHGNNTSQSVQPFTTRKAPCCLTRP
jgi:hypothetical protein